MIAVRAGCRGNFVEDDAFAYVGLMMLTRAVLNLRPKVLLSDREDAASCFAHGRLTIDREIVGLFFDHLSGDDGSGSIVVMKLMVARRF